MKYIDEFRSKALVQRLVRKIREIAPEREVNLMEVCGTHTQGFLRFGLDKLIPSGIRLISGPGCPVCVSAQDYIDKAMSYSKDKSAVIVTFGDMLRVPGSSSTLDRARADGAGVHIAYSPLDSIRVAQENPGKKVIFLAVGFETTAPTIALTVLAAKKKKIKNLLFFSSLKLITPAMEHLAQDPRLKLHGFLCPGHVSAIIGYGAYGFIPRKYGIGCCVAGFEPLDILEGIHLLLGQINRDKPQVDNQYIRVVTRPGNARAKAIVARVFRRDHCAWRGLGEIPLSGLFLKDEFSAFDAERVMPAGPVARKALPVKYCKCAEVLGGLLSPDECGLFAKSCSPATPVGPCMVSQEGACNVHYRFR
jgi:hydrogenase expression/formation protein HypD